MSDLLSPIRADGHSPQGTDPTEERDPLKAAVWQAIQPFADELERSGGVTFMGLRNAVAEAVRPFTDDTLSGFSGCGVRMVRGSKADIDLVQQWCHDASTIPALRARIRAAEASLVALSRTADAAPDSAAALSTAALDHSERSAGQGSNR